MLLGMLLSLDRIGLRLQVEILGFLIKLLTGLSEQVDRLLNMHNDQPFKVWVFYQLGKQ
jgi:hypothetical protein